MNLIMGIRDDFPKGRTSDLFIGLYTDDHYEYGWTPKCEQFGKTDNA